MSASCSFVTVILSMPGTCKLQFCDSLKGFFSEYQFRYIEKLNLCLKCSPVG